MQMIMKENNLSNMNIQILKSLDLLYIDYLKIYKGNNEVRIRGKP